MSTPQLQVSSSPHLHEAGLTTARMMWDVVIALAPAIAVSLWLFRGHAALVLCVAVLTCLGTEWLLCFLRGKRAPLLDGSALITALILALSLPWSAPWWIVVIGSVIALGLGKHAFGGLGQNLFNPAMVGRAFVMLSFAKYLGAPAYVQEGAYQVVSQATPLSSAKEAVKLGTHYSAAHLDLLTGAVNGSLGETSAIALVLGGLWLCLRRSASWEIPAGSVLGLLLVVTPAWLLGLTPLDPLAQLSAGAFVLGAFFIATDPVSSPLTPRGKWLYGCGFGLFVALLRVLSSYPEGVMFAILLMNALAPLINRACIPKPLGGFAPKAPAPAGAKP